MSSIFALVDCNNFYVSCERVFQPNLQQKPVAVLSNNDGCIVARSNEVKALGIPMGMPYFQAEEIIKKHSIAVFSSNYTLYADMSNRIMQTLSQFTPSMEIYSIDEAFLDLQGTIANLDEYGRNIRQTVLQWTGIPVSVGIAQTKTLAKIANNLAKKSDKAAGVLDLTKTEYLTAALERTSVADIWGVGRQIASKLQSRGINTAKELAETDTKWIQKTFSIMTVRTVLELRNEPCFALEKTPATSQSITVSRSFGKEVETYEQLHQALCHYVSRAAEKLRKQKLCAKTLTIFAMSNRFNQSESYYNNASCIFDTATDNTTELIQATGKLSHKIYRDNIKFKKAGVLLSQLVPADAVQLSLFDDTAKLSRDKRLMQALDKINANGKQLYFASEGISKPWQTKFNSKTPCYTTRWDELMQV